MAIKLLIVKYKVLLRIGAPLLAVLVIMQYFGYSFLGRTMYLESDASISFALPIIFVFLATLVMAVVGCHRIFLMNNNDVKATKTIRWTGREFRFIGWWIVLGLISSIITIPLTLIIAVMGVEANMTWAYLFSFFAIIPYLYFFHAGHCYYRPLRLMKGLICHGPGRCQRVMVFV